MLRMMGLSLLALVSACASAPVDLATAPQVPAERLIAQRWLKPGPATVPVIVSMDRSSTGGCCMGFHVNGELVARFNWGEVLKLYLPEGRNILETRVGRAQAFNSVIAETMSATAGPYVFRVRMVDGRLLLQPVVH